MGVRASVAWHFAVQSMRRGFGSGSALEQLSCMCLTVFIGSATPLTMVEWAEKAPAFNAGPLTPHEEAVRRVLTFPHLAMLGAHTCCSCGFVMDGADDPAAVRRSRSDLARYVTDVLRHGPAELYVCWNGEAELPFVQQLALAPDELLEREDWLEEGTYVRLIRPARR